MKKSTKYESAVKDAKTLESVIPKQLAEYTTRALSKLNEALGGDVGGYVANRLHMSHEELREALAAEQIDGVALAIHYCPVKILDLEINRVDHHPLGR